MTIIRDLFPRWPAPVPPPRRRRAARPAVSPLEGRALLSGLTASSSPTSADVPVSDGSDPALAAFDGLDDSANNTDFHNLFTIWDPSAGSSSTPASATAASTATPAEQKVAVTFDPKQVQSKYKHAVEFGVTGNYNPDNSKKFQDAMQTLIDAPGTKKKDGVYTRGNLDVTFYYDPTSKLMVMTTRDGKYISGWKLTDAQLQHIEKDGKVGGG